MPNLRHLAILLGLAAAACGDDASTQLDAPVAIDAPVIDATPIRTIMESQSLVPGELVEAILTGGPGDYAGIHLEAPTPTLDWNIHGHANGGTQTIHEALDQMTVDYAFVPTAHADWYVLIRNGGGTDMTVQVKFELYGGMEFRWQ